MWDMKDLTILNCDFPVKWSNVSELFLGLQQCDWCNGLFTIIVIRGWGWGGGGGVRTSLFS